MWNQIGKRIQVPKRDALVLYMAAKEDHDRAVAVNNGFKDKNLFAIDRDPKVVSALREDGVWGVSGEMSNAVANWSGKAHVIFADLCCGIGGEMAKLIGGTLYSPAFNRTVFAINLLRGREKFCSDQIRDLAVSIKHRAKFCFKAFEWSFRKAIKDANADSTNLEIEGKPIDFVGDYIESCAPFFTSYKSDSGQVFDSGVWRAPNVYGFVEYRSWLISSMATIGSAYGLSIRTDDTDAFEVEMNNAGKFSGMAPKVNMKNPIARQILAVRATRTRHLNAA